MLTFTVTNLPETSQQTLTHKLTPTDVILSAETTIIIQWILYATVCQVIAVFGIVTNIINIMCFVKQGFKETVNISLLGLAVSDLGGLITVVWTNLCFTPAFYTADLPFVALEVQYLTGSWPHVAFTHVSSWITALISLERCLCIAAPLKIKTILSPKRMTIIVISIYISLIFSLAPVYVVNKLEIKYFLPQNKSLLSLVFTEDRERIEQPSFLANNIGIPFIPVVIIVCCTFILVVKLQKKTKWRENNVVRSDKSKTFNGSKKVYKMVVMISGLFIVCYVPVTVIFMAASFEPGLAVDGSYVNIVIMLSGIVFILESVNSSMNIFIYYSMSSKYRLTFHKTICNTV